MDLPIENDDFPQPCDSLPEGKKVGEHPHLLEGNSFNYEQSAL